MLRDTRDLQVKRAAENSDRIYSEIPIPFPPPPPPPQKHFSVFYPLFHSVYLILSSLSTSDIASLVFEEGSGLDQSGRRAFKGVLKLGKPLFDEVAKGGGQNTLSYAAAKHPMVVTLFSATMVEGLADLKPSHRMLFTQKIVFFF